MAVELGLKQNRIIVKRFSTKNQIKLTRELKESWHSISAFGKYELHDVIQMFRVKYETSQLLFNRLFWAWIHCRPCVTGHQPYRINQMLTVHWIFLKDLHAPFKLKSTKWTTIRWGVCTFQKEKLAFVSVYKSTRALKAWKGGSKMWNNVNRRTFSEWWQRWADPIFSPVNKGCCCHLRVTSTSPHRVRVGCGSRWIWRQGKGHRSQGELAVTEFFVHLPPQSRHILLPKAERLSQCQTLAVLQRQEDSFNIFN